MAWFEVDGGRLRLSGRITRQPVREWVRSPDARTEVDAVARGIRFALFGRTRAARCRLSRSLHRAIASRTVRDTIAAECDRYLEAWTQLAYAPSLPRLTVASQRLTVVPRVMIAARAGAGMTARVTASLREQAVPDAFSAFLARWIASEMHAALRRATPRPERPVHAPESWACVAVDTDLLWVDPLWSGEEWRGHVVMFEMPAPRIGRRVRRELRLAIERLAESLPLLPRLQRDNMVRLGTTQMTELRF